MLKALIYRVGWAQKKSRQVKINKLSGEQIQIEVVLLGLRGRGGQRGAAAFRDSPRRSAASASAVGAMASLFGVAVARTDFPCIAPPPALASKPNPDRSVPAQTEFSYRQTQSQDSPRLAKTRQDSPRLAKTSGYTTTRARHCQIGSK